MTFKEIKKRSVYKTWQHKNKKTGLKVLIHLAPKNLLKNKSLFHFSISCTKKYCNKLYCHSYDCEQKIRISSLDKQNTFETFDECIEEVRKLCNEIK